MEQVTRLQDLQNSIQFDSTHSYATIAISIFALIMLFLLLFMRLSNPYADITKSWAISMVALILFCSVSLFSGFVTRSVQLPQKEALYNEAYKEQAMRYELLDTQIQQGKSILDFSEDDQEFYLMYQDFLKNK